jgi:TolB-like protein
MIDLSESAIRQQLDQLLQSKVFVQSERLSRFLRFIVERVLTGSQDHLKEYVIGCEVYDRKPPYHPSQDSIVRTEARRLRCKLKEYYETEGRDAPVFIYLRIGSYIPAFQSRSSLAGVKADEAMRASIVPTNPSAIAVAILPFSDISGNLLSAMYARGVPEELAYMLTLTEGCKVAPPVSIAHMCAAGQDVATMLRIVGADIAIDGSVRVEGNQIRVTSSLVDAAGFRLWTKRIDTNADSQPLFSMEEQIASLLCSSVSATFGSMQRASIVP